jgi:hypothetical protein
VLVAKAPPTAVRIAMATNASLILFIFVLIING